MCWKREREAVDQAGKERKLQEVGEVMGILCIVHTGPKQAKSQPQPVVDLSKIRLNDILFNFGLENEDSFSSSEIVPVLCIDQKHSLHLLLQQVMLCIVTVNEQETMTDPCTHSLVPITLRLSIAPQARTPQKIPDP